MNKKLYTDILEGDKDLAAMAGLPLTAEMISQFHIGLINGGNFEWYVCQSPKTRQTILKELTMVIPINEQNLQAWTTIGQRFRNYITANFKPEEETDITPINVELREEDKQYEEDMKTLADLKKKLQEEDEEDMELKTDRDKYAHPDTEEYRERVKGNVEVESTRYEYVNHPTHYNKYSMEVIDMMVKIWGPENAATFCEMNAYKYRMRLGLKPENPIDQDLKKEKWYLDKAKQIRKDFNLPDPPTKALF